MGELNFLKKLYKLLEENGTMDKEEKKSQIRNNRKLKWNKII